MLALVRVVLALVLTLCGLVCAPMVYLGNGLPLAMLWTIGTLGIAALLMPDI
jgi:hypothetical protein